MQIREYREEDIETVVLIWLKASVEAHDFIDPGFWQSKADDMRRIYIPSSKTFIWSADEKFGPEGFLSLCGDHIAALFVDPVAQGRGIGSALVDFAKLVRNELSLNVYSENKQAVAFYLRHGFSVANKGVDEQTGHPELVMRWRAE